MELTVAVIYRRASGLAADLAEARSHRLASQRHDAPRWPRPPAPPDPARALTPGQGAWLAALTAEERARFDTLPERSRARFLEWHCEEVNQDSILAGEVARLLRPKVRSAPGDELVQHGRSS